MEHVSLIGAGISKVVSVAINKGCTTNGLYYKHILMIVSDDRK